MYLTRKEVRRIWGLLPRYKISGTRISFEITVHGTPSVVAAESYRSGKSQVIVLRPISAAYLDHWFWVRIKDRIRDAALACHPSVTVVEESESGESVRVSIGNLGFVDAFAPAWGMALKKAGLNPRNCYIGPFCTHNETAGESLQKWLDEIPVAL
jgi:hypothetical protein